MSTARALRLLLPWFAVSAAAVASAATATPSYTLRAAHSALTYTFTQAGAANQGRFKRFSVRFDPGAGTLLVVIDMRSFDTGDAQRNQLLGGADFFDVAHYPQARFQATELRKTASGYVATGPLTLRGVTRTVTVPFTWRLSGPAGHRIGLLDGQTVLKRLDFGVGQGQWRATEWLGNAVTVHFALRLAPAAH